MKQVLAVVFALMLLLSGCLDSTEPASTDDDLETLPVETDTDEDGTPDSLDDDDDGDLWLDAEELTCDSDPLVATDVPIDTDNDRECDLLDFDDDGDGFFDDIEDLCNSDSLSASSVPSDLDEDGTCDVLDTDTDEDGFSDDVELLCGSDPLNLTSLPADLDEDGTCDALDDDIDGDGADNDVDEDPNDPTVIDPPMGCTNEDAFNYNASAEQDDGSCFTLEDAEAAMQTAMAGVISSQSTGYSDDMPLQTTMIMDMSNDHTNLTIAMLGENGEVLYQATYVNDGSGFVGVDLYLTPDEEGLSPISEEYKVSGAYYAMDMSDGGWSHCEYDGTDWHCTDITSWEDGEMMYNSDSATETYHLYTCADGDTVLLSQVNDGTEDCADGSDEPDLQTDGSEFMCDDGSTIDFYLANDGAADCADGSDEDNFITEYTCANGNTVPYYYINDDDDDCGDGSDEPVYDMSDYETSVYTCEDGSEVPLSSVNDGMDDCTDGTDENPTGGEISPLFTFECMADEMDIPLSYVNDGVDDCSDGADEPTYDEFQEETSEFECMDFELYEEYTIMLSEVNDGVIDCDLRQDEAALAGNETDNWFGVDEDGDYNGDCTLYGGEWEIPFSWVNDGIDDCDDGTDEPAYDENGDEVSTMMCDDGTEIPLSYANDGEEDCEEGEDETTFAMVTFFECENGEEITFDWINDEEEDCEDGSDEPTYDLEELTDFECEDGTLIAFSLVNDGSDDCTNAEDEPDYQEVEYSTFECASGDEIPLSYVNDGADDCPAGDDEPSYDPVTQNEVSTYTCLYSGETIALSLVNDGMYDDCEDGTDEPEYDVEELNEMECADGSDTIPISWANDGWEDCMDGSDEAQYEMPEDESVFSCADGSEITVSQFNDGAVDCGDGSDERATFMCDDGSGEIPFAFVNDGGEDCMDGSDESMVEDMNVVDCYGSENGVTLTASQFHDGWLDCESGWDEMEFELAADCEWTGDDTGWMCTDVFFLTDATYEMWMHTDENGLEMIGLNGTSSDGAVMTAMFDAATHAFLMMEGTYYDEDGILEEHMLMKSVLYDSTIADALVVDLSLDTHAPPFAVVFYGEPHAVDDGKVFVCDDGEEVLFAYANDGEEDCADGSDEPTYEEEVYTCSDDGSEIPMSWVNDGEDDCMDGSDEPAYDGDGEETSTFTCIHSGVDGDIISLSYVNDGYEDCMDGSDEQEGYSFELSGFECDDGEYDIDLSQVNNGEADCMDASDEATVGEGHGYGDYTFMSTGIADWTMGDDDDMLEIVFAMCDTFGDADSSFAGDSYLIPSDCGDELARYTIEEIDNGNITGLMCLGSGEDALCEELIVDEDFELDGWNTVRLSTPSGEYADENPQVQLPAPGIGFAVLAMLGAAMMAGRRNE